MVMHNIDLGVELAERAFPDRSDLGEIVQQHILEDLGYKPRLSDWIEQCNVRELPRPFRRRLDAGKDGVIELVAAKLHPCIRSEVEKVYDILTLPLCFAPDYSDLAYCILMNTVGPPVIRRIFGPPREIEHAHGKSIVDMAWIAEALIFTMFGRIPELGEVVRCCTIEPLGQKCRKNAIRL
jgi:hypothetical protein